MIFKTIIIENIPTVNKRVYETGSLQKFKDYLTERIDNKICLVWFGNVIPSDEAIKNGHPVGYVKTFDIQNGQGVIDVELLDTPNTELVKSVKDNLQIDFYLNAVLNDEKYIEGCPVVDLTEFSIDGLRLISVKQDEE